LAPDICYTNFMDNPLAVPGPHALIPAQVAAAGADACRRFLEFFTANIRNRNTRQAYARAVAGFFHWCEARGLRELGLLEPVHVAAYVEQLGTSHAAPSVKQHLAAVRMLFDWLVVGQVGPVQPRLGRARPQARGQAGQDAGALARGGASAVREHP
jgi:site-specific recombinase XerC